ncbi:hypothetical protein AK830_g1359 [Neonectria ditissima]|uniref:N-acetyltransferase domain-containing protein n=1 Tax=Neonectria ditissima TaxID=78410 RepID=A0A0P7BX66_9HYPO|nr:hypothetical protein AK830_g1359 [Neonectria ditissima]
MARISEFEVFELTLGTSPTIIDAAARTVCHAFSDDPLITWLRPAARPWSSLDPAIMTWQRRRIYQNIAEGRVFGVKSVHEDMAQLKEPRLPAVAFVAEPFSFVHWLSGLMPRIWLRVLQVFSPIFGDADDKRVVSMMTMHGLAMASIREKINKPLTYVEVVAVDPKRQGSGLGSLLLQNILSRSKPDSLVVLESTSKNNIGFYERLGFTLADELTLRADFEPPATSSQVKLWVMVRE